MPQHDSIIMTHSDCDGICAGAIALSRFPNARIFFTKPVSFAYDLKNNALTSSEKRLIITDIALAKRHAREAVTILSSMKKNIMYFDHHVIPRTVTDAKIREAVSVYDHDLKASASEIIYRYFQKSLPKERVWLALYGAIGDYTDDTVFTEDRLLNWDKRALYFEVSTLVMGIKEKRFSSYNAKRTIIEALSEGQNPSDVNGLVKAAKTAVNREFDLYKMIKRNAKAIGSIGYIQGLSHFGFRGPAALFAANVTNRPVGISIHSVREFLDITARSRSSGTVIKLNQVMEKAAEKVGGLGGGHPHAAGARIPSDSLDEFLKEVDKLIKLSK